MLFENVKGVPIERIPFCDLSNESSVLFVLNSSRDAEYIYNLLLKTQKDFKIIKLDFFDSEIYESTIADYEIFKSRALALTRILNSEKKVVVATIESLNYKIPQKEYFLEVLKISNHQRISMKYLIQTLMNFGYFRSEVVKIPGSFSVRGGIIDLFPLNANSPSRIDFLGGEIESIKTFDSDDQISNGFLDSLVVIKCSEIILNEESIHLFRQRFKFKNDHIKESVENGNYFPGIEWYQSCFQETLSNLLDYFPRNTKFIFDFDVEKYNKLFFEKCQSRFSKFKNVLPVSSIFEDCVSKSTEDYDILKTQPFNNNNLFINHTKKYNIRKNLNEFLKGRTGTIILSASSNGSFNILSETLKNENVNIIENFQDAEENKLNLIISELKSGFLSSSFDVYTEEEIFGEILRFARKKSSKDILKDYSKFSVGDYIVHEKHGIAIFEGLINIDVSGVSHDFLSLKYRNEDKLYVPIENIGLISRYGDADSNVQLDFLKGSNWTTRKINVRKKLLVIANDLLKLAAKRKMNKTIPFEIPNNYGEFCKGFGYVETDDQLSAIDDILEDLTSNTPMDRLICGDVGFGKTEVALRAAFIVASSLKQVVLLAPTTILVSQHYKNFVKRFNGFGIEICQLSRFVSLTQIKRNLEEIKSGKVQIIIATHAVLSEKIQFADLGLVIIDEEQHFGVKQKEFLKKYHESTHFITLSATPIPRTLQLAVSGVKELSMITTPPTNRLPVKTIICDYEKETIRQAIENEVRIGGQVFFVTPRVEFLKGIFKFVSELCPDLRIKVVHGKSPDLEESIRDFCDCEIDILISTNIIDSGIDIPNANTILIHRFDLFGLSQLYQLRGRVGRSKRQAYAYLLLENNKILTNGAKKRIEVLGNLNKLGSGFTLASHDLDIRGAGNLLGEEQSGYIKEVGVELYQSMLKEAILMIKAGYGDVSKIPDKREVQINLGVPVLIPDVYIDDSSLRLEIYRRIGALDSENNIDIMEYELADRFGSIPFETRNLLTLMKIRINCLKANVSKIDVGPNGFIFSFFDNQCRSLDGLMKFLSSKTLKEDSGSFKIRNDQKIAITKKWKDIKSRTNSIYKTMRELALNMIN